MEMITDKKTDFDYTQHYKRWHSDTPEHIQEMKNYYKNMLNVYLPNEKDIRILDVGCGMGFTMLFLHDSGFSDVEGIDIDEGQVQSCLAKQLNAIHVHNSTEFLQERANSFDLIIAMDVIEHVHPTEQLAFLRSISLALRPNGKLICTVPNANSPLAARWRYIDWTHHISFTEISLEFLLLSSGFRNIRIFETEFFQKPVIPNPFSLEMLRWVKSIITDSVYRKNILIRWIMFRFVRSWQRVQMIAELGWDQGKSIPLSLNLLAIGVKSE